MCLQRRHQNARISPFGYNAMGDFYDRATGLAFYFANFSFVYELFVDELLRAQQR